MNEVLLHGYIMCTLRPTNIRNVTLKEVGDQNATNKTRTTAIFEKRFEFEQALIRDAIESAETKLNSNHLLGHVDVDASGNHHHTNAYLTEARSKLIDLERGQSLQELESYNETSRALCDCKKKFDKIGRILSTKSPPGRGQEKTGGNRNSENANKVIGWEFEKMREDIEKFYVRNQQATCEKLCKFAVERYREFETNLGTIREKTVKEAKAGEEKAVK